jgi:hypothetical protein
MKLKPDPDGFIELEKIPDVVLLAATMADVPLAVAVSVARQLKKARPTTKRPCVVCHRLRTPEGHDPCIANLPGVIKACCGHAVCPGYMLMIGEGSTGETDAKHNMFHRIELGGGFIIRTPDGKLRKIRCSIISSETHEKAMDRFGRMNGITVPSTKAISHKA